MTAPNRVPLSVLDLATVREGHTSADALRGTIEIAAAADQLGFSRFWVAEHHNMPAVASTSPPVLIGAIAAHTRDIRVGSGGVMLPNHMPFVVAEQFALLEALYPGRIDLGIGRAPGTDQATATALRGVSPYLTVEQFPDHLKTLLGLLGDERVPTERLSATPVAESFPELWILGSSTYGAQLAAALGLPFCFAYHFATSSDVDGALRLYRDGYQPSPRFPRPWVMVSTSVLAAETTEEAQFLAGPSRVLALSLRAGRPGPMVSPETAARHQLSDMDHTVLESLPGTQVAGTADEVVAALDDLSDRTGADEIMLAGAVHDPATRIDSLARIAKNLVPMTWHLTSDVSAFAENAGPFLRSSPARHTTLLTVTGALLLHGPHVYGEQDPILGWWTDDRTDEVSGALLQTPPYPLTVTEVPPPALPAAVAALASRSLTVTAVNLLAADAPVFTEAWLAQHGGSARPGMRTRLFELAGLTPPDPPPPGVARPATSADRPLVIDWFRGFHAFIGEEPDNLEALVDDRMTHGGVALWETRGTPVSMAVYTRPEAGMVRVQYVWAPPEHRQQGFGGAATTAATRNALDAGATDVVLFTDLANPTSNALYPRLGYRPIEDRAVVEFFR